MQIKSYLETEIFIQQSETHYNRVNFAVTKDLQNQRSNLTRTWNFHSTKWNPLQQSELFCHQRFTKQRSNLTRTSFYSFFFSTNGATDLEFLRCRSDLALRFSILLRKQILMNVRQNASISNRHRSQKLGELLVVSHSELNMPWSDPILLVVPRRITSQLQNLIPKFKKTKQLDPREKNQ